jgi:acetylornithine deacetylase/succinyl-diaminopimelate desuccinylase-like protein
MPRRVWTPFQRRRRAAARAALYGSLILVGGITWLLVSWLNRPLEGTALERWAATDYRSLPEVQLLRDYVRIDTSEGTGDEIVGARFLAARLEKAGIPSRLEVVGERKANLYAVLEGEDPRPLVLHNHIDVENVKPEEWFHPPFEAFIDTPWMYGRGVFDMKSVAIAQLLALVDLKESGLPLERSVLFLATSSEERGSRLGVRRLLAEDPERVRSFWAVLTEGGVVEARARDDIKFWGTEIGQKRYVDLLVCAGERGPLDELRAALKKIGYTETDLKIVPEVREVLKTYAATRDRGDLRDLLENPDATIRDVAAFRKLPAYLQSFFRNEAVPFQVREAPGGGWQLLIKIHLLPGAKLEEELPKLVPPWMLAGLSYTVDEPPAAASSSTAHPAFRAIVETLAEHYPEAPTGPYFLPWTATDSRFFRSAGVPSYGFSPFLIMNTDTLQVDKANERFALPGFVDGVRVYRDLVRKLVLGPGQQ